MRTREMIIAEYVSGKHVLDVGCVDHSASLEKTPTWLHRRIGEWALELTGLDIAERQVKLLQQRGYNIVCGDAQSIDLGRKFDCIVAGELLEHLENPGLFLMNMRRHLDRNGVLLLTTPNPFYPKHLLDILATGKPSVNPEHTCWYCATTLQQLLSRIGFTKIDIHFVNYTERFFGIGRLPSRLRPWLSTNLVAVAHV